MKAGPERDLLQRYVKRLAGIAPSLGFSPVEWKELDEGRSKRMEERRAEEARAILAATPKGAWLTVLDERGAAFSSEQWAAEIGKARGISIPAYAVVIGGPDGIDPSLRAAARSVVCFGAMTCPHQLVRVMAGEQIYRALTILAGHPYHRA